jgi:HAE1 family hydrophobic/amphiphilic exporter-1
MRQVLQGLPGITVTHVGLLDAVGGQKPVQLSVQGADMATLQRLSDQLRLELSKVPGLVDLDSSAKQPRPTIDVAIDRDAAADRGLTVDSISKTLDVMMGGRVAGTWLADDDQNYDIRVSVAPQYRQDLADLGNTPLLLTKTMGADSATPADTVRLSQVARLNDALAPVQINRRDLNREVEFTANVSGRTVGEVSKDIQAILDRTPWPAGYQSRFGGSAKDMKESFGYAVSALVLGVLFIYMILASQFRSFLQPLALMTSLPLTLIGVVLTLLVFGSSISMFSVIGIIMLMGLVTKNAILLVDFANRARQGLQGEHGIEQSLGRREALLLAARVRLRPILMTSLAMVVGMVPLAFGLSEGAEQRAPMGQAVIGGVVASSLLTLVVVPVVYVYTDRLAAWLRKSHPAKP